MREPVRPRRGEPRARSRSPGTAAARLVGVHGEAWGKALFEVWTERDSWCGPQWLSSLADVCAQLCADDGKAGARVAAWLLTRELDAALERCRAARGRGCAWLDLDGFGTEAGQLADALAAAARIGDSEQVSAAANTVASPEAGYPLLLRLAVLRAGMARSLELRGLLGQTDLYRGVVDELRTLVSQPARDPSDWSIDHPLDSRSDTAVELARFLRSPRQRMDWPLAQARRRDVHDAIRMHDLPVSHVTLRQGRPYVLQLRKLASLFEREAAHRAALREILDEFVAARARRRS